MTDAQRLRELMPWLPGAFLRRTAVQPGASDTDKAEAKYTCTRADISDAQLQAHFAGKPGAALGVSPFLADGKSCQWLVIDIDRYGVPLEKLMAHVKVMLPIPLPLVPSRTKSGGWHLFLFLAEAAESKGIHILANKIRFWLGGGPLNLYPGGKQGKAEIEVRPAQSMINAAEGDLGNFITLPLFNTTAEERAAWFELAEGSRIGLSTLGTLADEGDLEEGPCCLFPIQKKAERDGWAYRNLFSYQLTVFFKKKYPGDWKDRVRTYNEQFINPSLSSDELEKTLASVEKNDPHYICDKEPFEGVCNKALCQRRRFGVASKGVLQYINADSLTVIDDDPPTWFLTVYAKGQEVRMKLSTDQLQSLPKFKKRCIEMLHTVPDLPAAKAWETFINDLLSRAHVIPVPYSMTDQHALWELVWRFFASSPTTTKPDDIFLGKIYIENTSDAGSYAYFRQIDFSMYLARTRARFQENSLYSLLKEMELAGHVQLAMVKLEGIDLEVWRAAIPDRYLMTKMEDNLTGEQ